MVVEEFNEYINYETTTDQYTGLLYAAFKGNIKVIEMLLKAGANARHKNKFGIGVLHVAAQGDQPIVIYFFKMKGLNLREPDARMSTPLHWACWSKAEVTLQYLLAWVDALEDRD